MLCVVRISRSSCTSVSFSEVEERSVDLRHMAAVATQREPTSYVRPNISGGASSALLSSSTVTGCFQKGNSPQPSHEGGSNANRELIFDASSVSVIYGNGMTVQPASLELLACIRV